MLNENFFFRLAEEQLYAGVNSIIEAPFTYPEDYAIFKKWQKRFGVSLYTIICQVKESVRKKRFLERERHPVHFDSKRNYTRISYDYSVIPGKQIYVDTSDSVERCVRKVIEEMNWK